jgi:VWFA-related protein
MAQKSLARKAAICQTDGMKPIAGIFIIGALSVSGQESAVPAPDSPRPGAVFSVTSTLVQLDAVVTDSKGHHITDLTPGDFQVFEDGKPQKLTHFSYVQVTPGPTAGPAKPSPNPVAALPPAPSAQIRPEDARRTIVLMVDDLGMPFEDMAFVRSSLRKFANRQMQAGDLVSLCRTSGGSGVLQQFTTDRQVLLSLVEGLRWNPMLARPEQGPPTLATLDAVQYIVGALREMPGRKSVVLLSEGLIPLEGDSDDARAFQSLIDLANRSGTVIYTMQTTGLVAEYRPDPKQQQNLAHIADKTGGLAFANGNDLNWGLTQVLEDQAGYYLLGYHPPEDVLQRKHGEQDYHHVQVKVTRAGLHVRSRSGFFGETDDEALPKYQSALEQLHAAMLSPFKSSGVDLRLTALYAEVPKRGPVVRNLVRINAADLTWKHGDHGSRLAQIRLVAAATCGGDQPLATVSRVFDIRVMAGKMNETMREGELYTLDVPVPKRGEYQIRVAVRDQATARIGSATQYLQIPDFGKSGFTLTSVVLRDGEQTADKSGPPGIAAALRQFKRGGLVEFLCAIEKGSASAPNPDLETRVRVLRDGKEVYSAPAHLVELKGGGRAVGGALRLAGSITPGDYNLQVIVTERNGGDGAAVVQWTDFTVHP